MMTDADKLMLSRRIGEALQEVRKSRYPVLLLLADPEQLRFDLWQAIAEAQGLAVVDMLAAGEEPAFQKAVGAWPTLVDWVREQAVAKGGIMVTDLDAFVTKWPERERERILLKLLKSETRDGTTKAAAPIVIVTGLARLFKLPTDDKNYGRVLDLEL
jgi:hypothetical protein